MPWLQQNIQDVYRASEQLPQDGQLAAIPLRIRLRHLDLMHRAEGFGGGLRRNRETNHPESLR